MKTEKEKSKEEIFREVLSEYAPHRQGQYTLEDYYAMPEDLRVELIDGVFFLMDAPGTAHQIALSEISWQLKSFISEQGGHCLPLFAPVDVQLDCDDRTMIQPDILVICDRNKVTQRCILGAPDLVMEILSPGTARKDLTIKLDKYRLAGVREYWIIDLEQQHVIVYDFTEGKNEDGRYAIYGRDSAVPVRIFDGRCRIGLAGVYEEVSGLLKGD